MMSSVFPRDQRTTVARAALLALVCVAGEAIGQVVPAPNTGGGPSSADGGTNQTTIIQPQQSGSGGSQQTLGNDLPFLDPGSDIIRWDGHTWNINDNRVFRARFEKYLNAPAADEAEDKAYRETIDQILDLLSPLHEGGPALESAFKLLPKASSYKIDANLCDALLSAIYNVWLANRQQDRLAAANDALLQESRAQRRNAEVAIEGKQPSGLGSRNDAVSRQWEEQQKMARELRTADYLSRVAEIETIRAANKAKRELSELQAKIQFQGLMVQFFMQRRFEHVIMASRFYSLIFGQGDTTLALESGSDVNNLFMKGLGMPPTVSMLESLASEAIRDVDEGVDAFLFLLEQNDLRSASERLAEAFMVGEYLPKIRTLPREKKRQVLEFTEKANQLLSALDVKDYTLAESLVESLRAMATDFDYSKPLGAIETARTLSNMHLAKARNAAVAGDAPTVEEELKAAAEIWPRNPRLKEVSSTIFSQSDVQNQALVDLDALISQKNYRQIFNDQLRFIAATATAPERREQLQSILMDMQTIEGAIQRAEEMSRRGDHFGAWEAVERSHEKFPDDTKLNQYRAELTTRAAEFVRIINKARELEERGQLGSALSWFLKAQKMYPPSDYAGDGIHRVSQKILPETAEEGDAPGSL